MTRLLTALVLAVLVLGPGCDGADPVEDVGSAGEPRELGVWPRGSSPREDRAAGAGLRIDTERVTIETSEGPRRALQVQFQNGDASAIEDVQVEVSLDGNGPAVSSRASLPGPLPPGGTASLTVPLPLAPGSGACYTATVMHRPTLESGVAVVRVRTVAGWCE